MILDELTFGTFEEIEPGITEIMIDEGIELTSEHIDQIEAGLLERYSGKYSLLVNRKNSYSHTHGSMQKVSALRNLSAIAILIYQDSMMEPANIHQFYQSNIEVFENRADAIEWLKNSLKTYATS